MLFAMDLQAHARASMDQKTVYTCSDDCQRIFQQKLAGKYAPDKISKFIDQLYEMIGKRPIDDMLKKSDLFDQFWGRSCRDVIAELNSELVRKLDNGRIPEMLIYVPKLPNGSTDIRSKGEHSAIMALASALELAGRYQDAAKIYESFKMYEKAGKAREREKRIVVKTSNVSVDLNRLLEQLKDTGIVAVYRCPHCGGKLKISKDTTLESLKLCEHCGTEIETVELADFFKTVLS
jgi:DNA-directed RNA polymerase subunit RPC12/RpoP